MLVATCIIKIQLPGIQSLKGKRSVVKSILQRLSNEFNLAVAEVNHHDVWQTSEIGLAAVGVDNRYLHGLMEKAVAWIIDNRPDIYIDDYKIEIYRGITFPKR